MGSKDACGQKRTTRGQCLTHHHREPNSNLVVEPQRRTKVDAININSKSMVIIIRAQSGRSSDRDVGRLKTVFGNTAAKGWDASKIRGKTQGRDGGTTNVFDTTVE
jgi:hypothetical protein